MTSLILHQQADVTTPYATADVPRMSPLDRWTGLHLTLPGLAKWLYVTHPAPTTR